MGRKKYKYNYSFSEIFKLLMGFHGVVWKVMAVGQLGIGKYNLWDDSI